MREDRVPKHKRRGDTYFWVTAWVLIPASVALPIMLVRAYRRADTAALTPTVRVARVTALHPTDKKGRASFHLVNRSRRPVSIRSVKPSCSCVQVGDAPAGPIAPGDGIDLVFSVDIPEAGARSEQVDVLHDGSSRPLALRVEIVGRFPLPVIRRIRNGSPAFHSLSAISDECEVTVETREDPESEPWVTGMECDLDEVTIARTNVEETFRSLDYVDRIYTYRVGWNELPTAALFRGTMWLNRRDRDSPRISVGELSGSLQAAGLVSPTVVRIRAGDPFEEVILFAPHAGRWTLAPGTTLPSWLTGEWNVADGEQKFFLTGARHGVFPERGGTVAVKFVSDLGRTTDLTIVVDR
jgi:Protein of unknown function (DUF1573)